MSCAICNADSLVRYQCCSNDKHCLCESCCANIISSIINNGKIALLLSNKIPCYICDMKFQYEHLPENIQLKVDSILSTIPTTSRSPRLVEELNYYYNQAKELRHRQTNQKFIFITQRHYELLGKCVETYIQTRMKREPWNYEEIWLSTPNRVNIFVSDDFRTNTNGCLVLIQGLGAVRAGQWSRSCCVNESLDIGAMFPYMSKAKEHNLSVVILNPNQTKYFDEQDTSDLEQKSSPDDLHSFYLSSDPLPRSTPKPIPGLSTSVEHILYVYDHIITRLSPVRKLYFVAHSAGGENLMSLFRQREDDIFSRLSQVAFIDSIHSISPMDTSRIRDFLRLNATHFLASDQPLGHLIDVSSNPFCLEVSAGHAKHEYTSSACIEAVFDTFFPSSSKTKK